MLAGLTLLDKVEVHRLDAPQAAGATDVTLSTKIDTANNDLFVFLIGFGAIVAGAATSIEIKGSTDGGATYAALEDDTGNALTLTVADTDDNKVQCIEVVKPQGDITTLEVIVHRGTQNATVEFALCIRGNSRVMPSALGTNQDSIVRFIGADLA